MGIPYYTYYESSLSYKAIYNYVIFYFTTLMMTGLKILEDLENKQINFWLGCKLIVLDRMMINLWTK